MPFYREAEDTRSPPEYDDDDFWEDYIEAPWEDDGYPDVG